VTFTVADPVAHRDALLAIQVEYVTWVVAGIERVSGIAPAALLGTSIADYVATSLAKVCADTPPRGVFYLIERVGALVGMGGIRRLDDTTAEIKRMYVRASARGLGLGRTILARLLADADAFGDTRVHLDSAPFMTDAHRLYERAGFVDCPPYAGVEVSTAVHDTWRFMVREREA
jgi:GNAT superfamily N-acetyltransferase